MSQLQVPSLGQPLDVNYIKTMVDVINGIDSTVTSQSNLASSWVDKGDAISKKTSAITFAAESKQVTVLAVGANKVAASDTWDFQGVNFTNGGPIVVGTILSTAGTETNRELFLVLKQVTTGTATFEIFAPTGVTDSYSVQVNLIAIGVTS